MKTSSQYRADALSVLSGKWASPIIASLVAVLIAIIPSLALSFIPVVGQLLSYAISFPISAALVAIFIKFYREKGANEIQFGELFTPFTDSAAYIRITGTMFLMVIYVILGFLLLIVPGIIAAYALRLTPYILKDRKDLSFNEVIKESMRLMNGHKMELFLLHLSFIGWWILCILTLGIGYLWLSPYMAVAEVAFYEDLIADDPAYAHIYAPADDAVTPAEAPAAE